jgi:hypothetical protein
MAIKVKQDMIDFIKAQGMEKSLKRAGSLKAKGTKGEAEFIEGVRRMYGDRRLSAAAAKVKVAPPKPKDSRFSGVKKADPKKPTDSRFSGVKKTAPKPTDSRFSGVKATTAPKMPGKGPATRITTTPTRPRFGGFSMAADAISKAAANTPKAKRDARNAAAKKNK